MCKPLYTVAFVNLHQCINWHSLFVFNAAGICGSDHCDHWPQKNKNLVGLIYFSICSYVLCRHVWQCTGWLLTQMAVDSDIWYCSARWLCHLWRRLISLAMLWSVCDSILRCAVILLFIMKLASHSRMCILHSLLYVRHCCEKSPCNSVPRTQLVNFDYQPRSTFGMLLQLQDKYCLKESTCCIASYKALGLCCCSEVFT